MALQTPFNKLKSSLSHYIFATRELLIVRDRFPWQFLMDLPTPVIKNQNDYIQKFIEIRLSVLSNHIEIMRQALHEHINNFNLSIPELNSLGEFLFDLRNSLSHTKEKLLPKWGGKPKTKGRFTVNIPIKDISEGLCFDSNGTTSMQFSINVKPLKSFHINGPFFHLIQLLSFHILEILKKRNHSLPKLLNYLHRNTLHLVLWKDIKKKQMPF